MNYQSLEGTVSRHTRKLQRACQASRYHLNGKLTAKKRRRRNHWTSTRRAWRKRRVEAQHKVFHAQMTYSYAHKRLGIKRKKAKPYQTIPKQFRGLESNNK